MLVDLLLLAIIGCLLEGLATKMSGLVLNAAPTFTFSLLIIFVAVVRWNFWGLLLCPILPLATIIGGSFNDVPFMAAMYDWRIYLSATIGLLTLVGNAIVLKLCGTKKTLYSNWKLILMLVVDFILFNSIQALVYGICVIPQDGVILFVGDSSVPTEAVNLCRYAQGGFLYNLFGGAVAVIGTFVLRSQGVVNNVKDKLLEDKKNAELDRLDTENFSIPENIGEEKSSKANNEDALDTEDSSKN